MLIEINKIQTWKLLKINFKQILSNTKITIAWRSMLNVCRLRASLKQVTLDALRNMSHFGWGTAKYFILKLWYIPRRFQIQRLANISLRSSLYQYFFKRLFQNSKCCTFILLFEDFKTSFFISRRQASFCKEVYVLHYPKLHDIDWLTVSSVF